MRHYERSTGPDDSGDERVCGRAAEGELVFGSLTKEGDVLHLTGQPTTSDTTGTSIRSARAPFHMTVVVAPDTFV